MRPSKAYLPRIVQGLAILASIACGGSGGAGPDEPLSLAPDLYLTEIKSPELVSPGRILKTVFRYGNASDAIAPGTGVYRLLLSRDPVADDADQVLKEGPLPPVGPNAFTADSIVAIVRADVEEGSYQLVLILDATNIIRESSEGNNSLSRPIEIRKLPDLVVTAAGMQATLGADSSYFAIYGGFTIANSGTLAVPNVAAAYYVSRDTVLSDDDIRVSATCCFPVPGTDWGHIANKNNSGGLEPGEWYGIITVIEESGEKRDLNLADNTAHTPSTFTIPKTK